MVGIQEGTGKWTEAEKWYWLNAPVRIPALIATIRNVGITARRKRIARNTSATTRSFWTASTVALSMGLLRRWETTMFYKYGMRLRGFSIGCQPTKNLWRVLDDKSGKYHNILIYTRPLNDHEQEEFELDYLGEIGNDWKSWKGNFAVTL